VISGQSVISWRQPHNRSATIFELVLRIKTTEHQDSFKHGGGGVTDWIDKLAASDQPKAEQNRTQDELQLHKAKIIEAKAPEFWEALIETVRNDCEKLRKMFPDDRSRHCNLVKSGIDWTLHGSKLPWRILILQFNPKGQSVDISEGVQETRDRITRSAPDQIKISANRDDELEFVYRNRAHTTPASLAQHLISYVCEIG
jgi:hypothetical protein